MVHTGGIGDFILTCPAMACLPSSTTLTLLGNRERLELAVAGGLASAAYSLEAVEFHTVFTQPSTRLNDFLAGYHRVVVWMADKDGVLTRSIQLCGIQDAMCFPGIPPNDWNRPAAEYFADCLGIPPKLLPEYPVLQGLGVDISSADRLSANSAVIHPGSGGRHKCWPVENYQRLTEALLQKHYTVYWSLGPADEDIPIPMGVRTLPCSDLVRLGRILASAAWYIGNDSGITHLAAAVGCPVLAIFGPTNPRVWAPVGNQVHVLQVKNGWPTVCDVVNRIPAR